MCGIFFSTKKYSKNQVENKLDTIKFRGPDNFGYFSDDKVTLGHLRLSILDLEPRSNQPFFYDQYVVVFNGEIYNFKKLKNQLKKFGYKFNTKSDTEVLIVAFIHWNEKFLLKVNGMFAFVIYNKSSGDVFIGRDRLGVKPLYYNLNEKFVEVCSQISPISNNKICKKSLELFYLFGYVPTPFTIYENIKKLEPSSFINYNLKSKKISYKNYWKITYEDKIKIDYKSSKKLLRKKIEDAVGRRLVSDVNLGFFLSSGVDSSLVTAMANKIYNEKIISFSIGFNDPRFDESNDSEKIAKFLKINNKKYIFNEIDLLKLLPNFFKTFDEPFSDVASIPGLLLSNKFKKYGTVALSGDGGDELFFGYKHFKIIKFFSKIYFIPYVLRKIISNFIDLINIIIKSKKLDYVSSLFSYRNINLLCFSPFIQFSKIKKNQTDIFDYYINKFELNHINCPLNKCSKINYLLWLDSNSNVKVDRSSMAYSVEVRSPLLDYELIDFATKLPNKFIYEKKILKDILFDFIPKNFISKNKKGFSVPISKWINKELREEFDKYLTVKNLSNLPNFSVSSFLKKLNLHRKGYSDYSIEIWKIYCLIKWIKINKLKI